MTLVTQAPTGWRVADRSFAPNQLAAAQTLAEQLLVDRPDIQLVSLGGSLAAGLGHEYSDVDVDVVVDDFDQRQEFVEAVGVEMQINAISRAEMRRLLRLGTVLDAPTVNAPDLDLDERTLTRLVRLTIGIPIYVAPALQEAYEGLNIDVVRRRTMIRDAKLGAALVEDALGAQRYGDWRTALSASATALAYAADAVLAAAGDLYVHHKFLHRRLSRCPVTCEWADELWDLLGAGPPADTPASAVEAAIRRRLWLTSHLFGAAMLDGWHAPLEGIPPARPEGQAVKRDRYHLLMRSESGVGLVGPDRGLAITEPMARLWWALDGRPLADVATDLRTRHGAFEQLDDQRLQAVVATLVAKGVAAWPNGATRRGGEQT